MQKRPGVAFIRAGAHFNPHYGGLPVGSLHTSCAPIKPPSSAGPLPAPRQILLDLFLGLQNLEEKAREAAENHARHGKLKGERAWMESEQLAEDLIVLKNCLACRLAELEFSLPPAVRQAIIESERQVA